LSHLLSSPLSSLLNRTFHVPVVTPYELELGLGARDWECFYLTTLTGKGLYSALTPEEFQIKLDKVRAKRVRSSSESTASSSASVTEESQIERKGEKEKPPTSQRNNDTVAIKAESAVTIFQSAAAEYFSNRDYKGLVASVPENMTTEIAKGQYGIASSYSNTAMGALEQQSQQGEEESRGKVEVLVEEEG
jgi:hypothetical protein